MGPRVQISVDGHSSLAGRLMSHFAETRFRIALSPF
jgi:hypothetical protein